MLLWINIGDCTCLKPKDSDVEPLPPKKPVALVGQVKRPKWLCRKAGLPVCHTYTKYTKYMYTKYIGLHHTKGGTNCSADGRLVLQLENLPYTCMKK